MHLNNSWTVSVCLCHIEPYCTVWWLRLFLYEETGNLYLQQRKRRIGGNQQQKKGTWIWATLSSERLPSAVAVIVTSKPSLLSDTEGRKDRRTVWSSDELPIQIWSNTVWAIAYVRVIVSLGKVTTENRGVSESSCSSAVRCSFFRRGSESSSTHIHSHIHKDTSNKCCILYHRCVN